MALGGTNRGSGTNGVGATSQTFSPNANITSGARVFVLVAYDNAGTSGADPFVSITDDIGNTWDTLAAVTYSPGAAANDGTSGRLLTTRMNVGPVLSTTVITISFGAVSVTAKAWGIKEITAAAGNHAAYLTGASSTGATATPSITTASITSGDVILCFVSRENNGTKTADSDTTNGSWTLSQTGAVGAGAAAQEYVFQHKLTTGTGTQTFNPTFGGASADGTIGWVQLREISNGSSGVLLSESRNRSVRDD